MLMWLLSYISEESTPVMLAAINGHKDVVLILTQKGANLDLVNKVSVHVHMLYEKGCIIEGKI